MESRCYKNIFRSYCPELLLVWWAMDPNVLAMMMKFLWTTIMGLHFVCG